MRLGRTGWTVFHRLVNGRLRCQPSDAAVRFAIDPSSRGRALRPSVGFGDQGAGQQSSMHKPSAGHHPALYQSARQAQATPNLRSIRRAAWDRKRGGGVVAFRLMTWNVQNLFPAGTPDGPPTQAAFQTKLGSLAEVIDAQQPDVLALQEVGPPKCSRRCSSGSPTSSPTGSSRRIRTGAVSAWPS
jgi:hypothetical protein